jgi:hypothetical protein
MKESEIYLEENVHAVDIATTIEFSRLREIELLEEMVEYFNQVNSDWKNHGDIDKFNAGVYLKAKIQSRIEQLKK